MGVNLLNVGNHSNCQYCFTDIVNVEPKQTSMKSFASSDKNCTSELLLLVTKLVNR